MGVCSLQLSARDGRSRTVYASVNVDPAGRGFLVGFMAGSAEPPQPAGDGG